MQASYAAPGTGVGPNGQGASSGVGAALWRRKFWIIFPTMTAFFLSLAGVNMLEDRFTGEARVLLESRETVYSRPERDTRGADPAIDPEAVASQVHILNSKELALKVIRDLVLTREAEFDPVANGVNPVKLLMIGLGMTSDPRNVPLEERVLTTFQKRLVVVPQGKSRVLSIEFQSAKPDLAAKIANKIADEYLSREQRAKKDTSRSTSEWLDRAIEPLMKKVLEADAKVEAFRSAKGLFMGSNNVNISTQQLGEMNTQLSAARTQQSDLSSRAKLIREALRAGRIFETSEINNNELVRRLLEQRAGLKAQMASDERTLLPNHPRMKELASQLADLESQVRAAAERAAKAFENDSRAAGARVQSLVAEFNLQKKTAALSNEDEVQLKALERDATALREQLNSYRNKFLDAAARNSDAAAPADARIFSRAIPQSEPTFPKRLPIILLATLGTMVISIVLIASSALMAQQAAFGHSDAAFFHGSSAGISQAPPGQMPLGHAVMPPIRPSAPQPRKAGMLGRLIGLISGKKAVEPALIANEQPENYVQVPSSYAMPAPFERLPAPDLMSALPHNSAGGNAAEHGDSEASHAMTEQLARELSRLGYLGRAKIVMVFGIEARARTAMQSLRLGRRLAREGAAIVVDLSGQSNLHARAIGEDADSLVNYLDGEVGLPDIIQRDPRSRLHIIHAGAAISHRLNIAEARQDVSVILEALCQSYAFILLDAGALGGGSEAFADQADLFVVLARPGEDDHYLTETVERLEARGRGVAFLLPDEGGPSSPANDSGSTPQSGAA